MQGSINEFLKPRVVKVQPVSPRHARIVIEPFERGFGHTLGNALRRVLLSSLPGAAITEIEIEPKPQTPNPKPRRNIYKFPTNLKQQRYKLRMQNNALFMMLHTNSSELPGRTYGQRRPREAEEAEGRVSAFGRLENTTKEFQNSRPKRGKDSGHRAGDWICNFCNNHNYSFREVCNSCKTQTKIENLRQSLNDLTGGASANPGHTRPPLPRKRLQLKSGEKFEEALRANFVEVKPTIDLSSCQDVPAPQQVSPVTERGLLQAFEDSFNEYPFEKVCLMDLCSPEAELEGETGLDDEDSLELDKETLKILSFD